jgi:hypothetical protein
LAFSRQSVWGTSAQNAEKLNAAFNQCQRVILIFSVNGSGHMQGFAEMKSEVGSVDFDGWANASSKSLGGNFTVDWIKMCEPLHVVCV